MKSRIQQSPGAARSWTLFLFFLCAFSLNAFAGEEDLSQETRACLKCHNKPGESKKLDNGEFLSLHVSTEKFVQSMHGETDCEDCHTNIEAKSHGKVKTPVASKREYSLEMRESCRDCHKKNFNAYEDSLHAALVKEGSREGRKDAPLCSDCHNPHTVQSSKAVVLMTEVPCAKCHETIFKAYANDIHGQERIAHGKSAPICSDCHKAHEIKAASLGNTVKDACLNCHEDAVKQHKDWLPNTLRHFEAISCPVCHTPDAKRRVSLRLYDEASGLQVQEKLGIPQFEKLTMAADTAKQGLDERALWSLLTAFSQSDKPSSTVLRGRLEVMSGAEAHQLSDKAHAVKDCDTCHRAGAQAFQSVTLTIAGPDGRPIRHSVQKDVLTSLMATESIRGFYAIGSTRIKWLDVLLVMVVLGACGVPIAHMSVKRMFKNFRERLGAQKLAEQKAATEASSAQDPKNL